MSGNHAGGKKAANTNKTRHGQDFYIKLGQAGGKASRNGGFASDKVGKDGLTGKQRARAYSTNRAKEQPSVNN